MENVSVQNPSEPSTTETPSDRARAIASSFREKSNDDTDSDPPRVRNLCLRTPRSPVPSDSSTPTRSLSRSPPLGPRSRPRFRSDSLPRSQSNSFSDSDDQRFPSPSKRRSPSSPLDTEPERRVARRIDHSSSPYNMVERPSSDSVPETFVEGADSAAEPVKNDADKPNPDSRSREDFEFPKCPRRLFATSSRRAREGKSRDEVIVQSEAVGFIIGKHGESIKAITSASGATVAMDKYYPGPDRKFDIMGSAEAVAQCREMIIRKLDAIRDRPHEYKSNTAAQDSRRSTPRPASRSNDHMEDSDDLWIPQNKIGMIIGTGGSTIRSINERSGAHATVLNERVEGDRKLVVIQGSSSSVQFAKQMILDLIDEPTVGHSRPPPHRDDRSYGEGESSPYYDDEAQNAPKLVYIPRSAVGFVIGKNGSMIRQLQIRSKAVIKVCSDEESGDSPERLVTISGSPKVIEIAHTMIMKIIERGSSLENSDYFCDRRESEDKTEDRVQPASSRRRQGPIKHTFSLSAEHIGLLIGKSGVTINDIQNRSKATVEVTGKRESERDSSTRKVSIVGTKSEVKIAKILIKERLGLNDSDSESEQENLERPAKSSDATDTHNESRLESNHRDEKRSSNPSERNPAGNKSIVPPDSMSKPNVAIAVPTGEHNTGKPEFEKITGQPTTETSEQPGKPSDPAQTPLLSYATKPPSQPPQVPPAIAMPSAPMSAIPAPPGNAQYGHVPLHPHAPPPAFQGYPYLPPGQYPAGPYAHPGQMYGDSGMMHFPQFGQHPHAAPMPFGHMPSNEMKGYNTTPPKVTQQKELEVGEKKEEKGDGKTVGQNEERQSRGAHGNMAGHGFYGYRGHGVMFPPHMYGGFGYPPAAPGGPHGHFGYGGQGGNGFPVGGGGHTLNAGVKEDSNGKDVNKET